MPASVHPRPSLRFAENTEHAAFEIRGVGSGQRERTAIGLAILGVVDLAAPLTLSARLHRKYNRHSQKRAALLAGVGIVLIGFWPPGGRIVWLLEPNQIAAKRPAAIDYPHLAGLVARKPRAEGVGSRRR